MYMYLFSFDFFLDSKKQVCRSDYVVKCFIGREGHKQVGEANGCCLQDDTCIGSLPYHYFLVLRFHGRTV